MFQSDEGGFINGTIAAHMTESNIIGVVGPIEVGDIKLYIDGFVAGPGLLIGAVLAAGLIGAVMLAVLGANPLTGYAALPDGAFGGAKNLANYPENPRSSSPPNPPEGSISARPSTSTPF